MSVRKAILETDGLFPSQRSLQERGMSEAGTPLGSRRMNGVDPMASKYSSLSPYNFAFNDPVYWSDPTGADPLYEETTRIGFGETMQGGYFRPHIMDNGIFGRPGGGPRESLSYAHVGGMTGTEYSRMHELARSARNATGEDRQTLFQAYGMIYGDTYIFRSSQEPSPPTFEGPAPIDMNSLTASLTDEPGPKPKKKGDKPKDAMPWFGTFFPGGDRFWETHMGQDFKKLPGLKTEKSRGILGDAIDDLIDIGLEILQFRLEENKIITPAPGPIIPPVLIPPSYYWDPLKQPMPEG